MKDSLPLPPAVFTVLAGLIEERSGLRYVPADRELLADRLSDRAREAGFESLLDYYYFLRYDAAGAAAMDALVETLVVHETFFFREAEPLAVLVDTVLAPAVRAGETPRVWCAACATGEEPLTLAMMLAERGVLSGVRLVASDISQRVLDRAQREDYGRRALRAMPVGARRWVEVAGESVRVSREVREAVDWRRINLVTPDAAAGVGTCDAILCRNLLIYFSEETVRRVVGTLTRALRPGGYLLVGASESLLALGTELQCEERGGVFFYRKGSE